MHLWRFDDDAERRAFWKRLFGDEAFLAFAAKIRTLIRKQDVQLLNSSPWGPTPWFRARLRASGGAERLK